MQCHTQREPSDTYFHFVYANPAAGKGSVLVAFFKKCKKWKSFHSLPLVTPAKSVLHFVTLSKKKKDAHSDIN